MVTFEFTRSNKKAAAIEKAIKQIDAGAKLVPVVYGRWVSNGVYAGHRCNVCNDYYTDDATNLFYCPRCGAKMTEIEKIEYRRNGVPIGEPHKVTICKHGRRKRQ